ncbi:MULTISPECIES: cation diffusion facilitator family transporter [Bradyrhizobium]|uniref:cation diffusion facilitator family transporter n=1 Tax=Bradyrhizobium elkanii TaxID=29448 RepID=UPI0004212202|nr:cation diffusion facilitator family transporter [Bradyrhizobium elkanii]
MARVSSRSKKIVYAALAGNLLVAVTKFAAALFTGSSSMLSEGVHSLVDTGNEALLLYGYHRSSLEPDASHPLGYGRELYFWSFVVAILLFALGAGVSLYEGVLHVMTPIPIENVMVSYVVLALSFLFEGASWWFALKGFRASKGGSNYLEAVRKSKDPPSFMVLLEDTAALIGISIAALGIYLSVRLQRPEIDGVGSILIGLVLAATAWLLARETKELLIGEPAHSAINASIVALAEKEPCVEGVNGVTTVHLAPDQIVASLSLEFSDELRTPDIERCVEALEKRIRAAHPEVVSLFIKPQTRHRYEAVRRGRFGGG